MGNSPSLYEFTEWLSEEYGTNGSTARAGSIGEVFFKCDEDSCRELVFEWNGDIWEEVGIIKFDKKYEARSAHRELCDSTNEEVGWNPREFVRVYQ